MSPLRDAGLSALVALGLFAPMVGLVAEAGPGGQLVIGTRPVACAVLVGLVFLGRLAMGFRRRRPGAAQAGNRDLPRLHWRVLMLDGQIDLLDKEARRHGEQEMTEESQTRMMEMRRQLLDAHQERGRLQEIIAGL